MEVGIEHCIEELLIFHEETRTDALPFFKADGFGDNGGCSGIDASLDPLSISSPGTCRRDDRIL
jgi:hypothetical protein